MPRFQVGSVDLAEDEIDWLKAVINLNSTSARAQVGQILQGHLLRFKPHYKRKISYTARKYGLTFDECFKRLVAGSLEGLPVVEEAPIREAEEFSNFGVEVDADTTEQTTTD